MQKIIIAYVPVLHEGYRKFFEEYKDSSELYILGQDFISEFAHLSKEIRALEPGIIKKSLESWDIFKNIFILDKLNIKNIQENAEEIIMPNEDIMKDLAEKYFAGKNIVFDEIFLRWDKHNSVKEYPVSPEIKITAEEFDKEMMILAGKEAETGSDWWRRVGVVIVKDGKVLVSDHNKHVPSEHMPFVSGDPRSNFHKGMHLELSTAIHGEAAAIAEAARKGISLEGASIYVTTFPCPPCAKLIAYSGIKKLYYNIGYGVLDGEGILKAKGVEIVFVDVDIPEKKGLGVVNYESRRK